MPSLESAITTHFAAIKGTLFLGCFVLAALIQFVSPHQNSFRDTLGNWKVNIPLGLLNTVLFGLLCGGCVCVLAERVQNAHSGLFNLTGVSYAAQLVLSFILLDLIAYTVHRFYHRVPLFWKFHASHHSDVVFETSTAIRFHPGELFFSLGIRLFAVWILGIPVLALLAFEAIYILFNLMEHSDFNLPNKVDGWLSVFFITPALHRLHHSSDRTELNSNYGTIFSVWDRLFGTYRAVDPARKIGIGLGGPRLTLTGTLLLPVRSSSSPEVQP